MFIGNSLFPRSTPANYSANVRSKNTIPKFGAKEIGFNQASTANSVASGIAQQLQQRRNSSDMQSMQKVMEQFEPGIVGKKAIAERKAREAEIMAKIHAEDAKKKKGKEK